MWIIRHQEAIVRRKTYPSGEDVRRYYLPPRDPLEVIETTIPPDVRQPPQVHEIVREATLVLEGKVIVGQVVGGKTDESELQPGDFVVFDPQSCHIMENRSSSQARTLTFKFLGESKDSELFATDKIENCTGPSKPRTSGNDGLQFESYVRLYNNLDSLLWQIPAFLASASGIGFALLSSFFTNPSTAVAPFTHNESVGAILFFWSLFYLLGVYAMGRIRLHHTLAGYDLARLETVGVYFRKRKEEVSMKWPPAAPHVFRFAFSVLAIALFGLAVYFVWSINYAIVATAASVIIGVVLKNLKNLKTLLFRALKK